MELVRQSWSMKAPIRLLTVTAIQLQPEEAAAQLSFLPAEEGVDEEKGENLERAMDHIRQKFGDGSITFGRVLGNDIGIGIEMDQHQEED
jgi:DNA polymerase-4